MNSYTIRPSIPASVAEELNFLNSFTQKLLHHRGISTRAEAEAFLNPSYEAHLHDPYLLPDMEKAVERILQALTRKEKIAIWSDYDCDGIPAGALLYDFFKKIDYPLFQNYIPHRHTEGYGMNTDGITKLHEDGVTLIITADVGIVDHEPVKYANSLGIDVVVTDHHLPSETLPPAYAVINVKRADNTYPFDGLCGAGTAFKLVQALIQKGTFKLPVGWEKWLLDMAALATVADMMPLRGENRAIVHFGLKVLRKSPRVGLQKLCRLMRTDQRTLNEDDIGFMIAPRINAASRMDHPVDAFKLLTTRDEVEAGILAEYLNKINDERKGVVASVVKDVKRRVSQLGEREVIVLGNPEWRPALLGLVANSLVEEYQRPVFLWGREGSLTLKGSCRSDGSVNVVELMGEAREVLIEFGGHKFSGGFSLETEKAHLLENVLITAYKKMRINDEVIEQTFLDGELSLDEVTFETYREIEALSPFGEGNPKPIFLFRDLIVEKIRQFGKRNEHLSLDFAREGGAPISAIAFFATPDAYQKKALEGEKISLVAHLEKSNFKRTPELRLRIVDIV